MRGLLGSFVILSIVMFSYQNCGDGFKTTEDEPSYCVEKLVLKTYQDGGWSADICENADNYICDSMVYSPSAETKVAEEEQCFADGDGELCKKVLVRSFNTAELRNEQNVSANAFDEGGEYNFTSYICSHRFIVKSGRHVIRGEGDSLEQALAAVSDRCNQGAKQ